MKLGGLLVRALVCSAESFGFDLDLTTEWQNIVHQAEECFSGDMVVDLESTPLEAPLTSYNAFLRHSALLFRPSSLAAMVQGPPLSTPL